MTIEQNQVMPMLLNACPSFNETWQASLKRSDTAMLYLSLGEFARHLRELYLINKVSEFSAVAAVIEKFHLDGTPYVKEAASIGLLEAIQNAWRKNGLDPEEFVPYLKPESLKWWRSLNAFWEE